MHQPRNLGTPLLHWYVTFQYTIIHWFSIAYESYYKVSPPISPLSLSPKVKAVTELVRYLLQQLECSMCWWQNCLRILLNHFLESKECKVDTVTTQMLLPFYMEQSLRVQGSTAVKPTHGNCKRGWTNKSIAVDERALPKGERLSQKSNGKFSYITIYIKYFSESVVFCQCIRLVGTIGPCAKDMVMEMHSMLRGA